MNAQNRWKFTITLISSIGVGVIIYAVIKLNPTSNTPESKTTTPTQLNSTKKPSDYNPEPDPVFKPVEGETCEQTDSSSKIPFVQTPECFAVYLSNTSWSDGISREFSDLKGCRSREGGQVMSISAGYGYQCLTGYITTQDPRGTKVCEIVPDSTYGGVSYNRFEYNDGTPPKKETNFRGTRDCVWR